MDAVFLVLMGVGGFMMFEAYKNQSPTPLTKALSVLNGTQAATGGTAGPMNTSLDAGTLTFPSYAG